jgi:hypothetical protein
LLAATVAPHVAGIAIGGHLADVVGVRVIGGAMALAGIALAAT